MTYWTQDTTPLSKSLAGRRWSRHFRTLWSGSITRIIQWGSLNGPDHISERLRRDAGMNELDAELEKLRKAPLIH